jgi:hypothetical protein
VKKKNYHTVEKGRKTRLCTGTYLTFSLLIDRAAVYPAVKKFFNILVAFQGLKSKCRSPEDKAPFCGWSGGALVSCVN